jgi:murein endopeptidase
VRATALLTAVLTLLVLASGVHGQEETPPPGYEPIVWHRSIALGKPFAGRLVNGVRLPAEGQDYFTWDPVLRRSPDRPWRRWGTDRLIRVLLRVLREHRTDYPWAPRVGIGDLSRPHGGDFGSRFGGIGHASHQNGLDVDVYYPRLDGRELRAGNVVQIDLLLAQDLIDRFVAAGAQWVFVGPNTDLTGPRDRVMALVHHDDHMHVRISPRRDR